MAQNQEISQATNTGNVFPGIGFVQMYDEANQYVLAKLKPWTVYMPGTDQLVTLAVDMTYTVADFIVAAPKLSYSAKNVLRGTYNPTTGIWTYPVVTEPYVFT